MKKIILTFIMCCLSGLAFGQNFNRAEQLYKKGEHMKAAQMFFQLARKSKNHTERLNAKLFLGRSLAKMKYYQTAAFPLVDVARSGSTAQKKAALNALVFIADKLDDATLLNYSLSKVTASDLTEIALTRVYMRFSDLHLQKKDYHKALEMAEKALGVKSDMEEALYQVGLIYLYDQQPQKAIPFLERLVAKVEPLPVLNRKRGMAIMTLARAHYQARHWQAAVELYRQIPKDHYYYRASLMELSWALFRSGQYRSALSPMQTLHTPYYANFFDPESLLLRGIILLFACRYDEIEPVLEAFDQLYRPAYVSIQEWLKSGLPPIQYFKELDQAVITVSGQKRSDVAIKNRIPFFIMRTIMEDTVIAGHIKYMKMMLAEMKMTEKLPAVIADYSRKILKTRIARTQIQIGDKVRSLLEIKHQELGQHVAQVDFLRYEMLNGQRVGIKKKISLMYQSKVDEEASREFYIQNGYRYWPFDGEYWRDEIGSYQYLGVNACEK